MDQEYEVDIEGVVIETALTLRPNFSDVYHHRGSRRGRDAGVVYEGPTGIEDASVDTEARGWRANAFGI